jgi:hypothetical protein
MRAIDVFADFSLLTDAAASDAMARLEHPIRWGDVAAGLCGAADPIHGRRYEARGWRILDLGPSPRAGARSRRGRRPSAPRADGRYRTSCEASAFCWRLSMTTR